MKEIEINFKKTLLKINRVKLNSEQFTKLIVQMKELEQLENEIKELIKEFSTRINYINENFPQIWIYSKLINLEDFIEDLPEIKSKPTKELPEEVLQGRRVNKITKSLVSEIKAEEAKKFADWLAKYSLNSRKVNEITKSLVLNHWTEKKKTNRKKHAPKAIKEHAKKLAKNGWTQREIAEQLGTHFTTICRWLQKRPQRHRRVNHITKSMINELKEKARKNINPIKDLVINGGTLTQRSLCIDVTHTT